MRLWGFISTPRVNKHPGVLILLWGLYDNLDVRFWGHLKPLANQTSYHFRVPMPTYTLSN